MWAALFLICMPNIGCEEVIEIERTYYTSQEKCESNANRLAGLMVKRFNELGYSVEIGYRCDLDKSIRES